ncbi:MAG: DegT/DnrJ/EryC1/StrS family aminotransferase [Rubellimicrobium sp.]|nr:DegT/DnrJ/EryC1/StrS family aminotransferase [Rubellimicrobium sp.]
MLQTATAHLGAAIKMVDLDRQEAVMRDDIRQAIDGVLAHKCFVNGPEVRDLETALAERLGHGWHAIGCANGTDALQLMLRAGGIGAGSCVALPSLTFAATAEAVRICGAEPVFVDIDRQTGTLCPTSLTRAFKAASDGHLPPISAVLPVDLFAIPADHGAIREIATRHGALHFVDAAHSYGGISAEGPCGTQGFASALSFYPSKALGCYGDGGAVLTADPENEMRVRAIANHGVLANTGEHRIVGTNSRLDSIQAAILLVKLRHFDAEIAARQRIAQIYIEALGNHCVVPEVPAGARPVWSYFAIHHRNRDALMEHLSGQGISSVAYYRRTLDLQPAFAHEACVPGGLPETRQFSETLLCLPIDPYLDDDELDRIIRAIRTFKG